MLKEITNREVGKEGANANGKKWKRVLRDGGKENQKESTLSPGVLMGKRKDVEDLMDVDGVDEGGRKRVHLA